MVYRNSTSVHILIALLTAFIHGCGKDEFTGPPEPSVYIEGPSIVGDEDLVILKAISSKYLGPTHYEWIVEDENGQIVSQDKIESTSYSPRLPNVKEDTILNYTVKAFKDGIFYSDQHQLLITDKNTEPTIERIDYPDDIREHDRFIVRVFAKDEQQSPQELRYRISSEVIEGDVYLSSKRYSYLEVGLNEIVFEVDSVSEPSVVKFDVEVLDGENRTDNSTFTINIIPTEDRLGDYKSVLDSSVLACILSTSQDYTLATAIDQITDFLCRRTYGSDISKLTLFTNLESIDLEFKLTHGGYVIHRELDFSKFSQLRKIRIHSPSAQVQGLSQLRHLESIDIYADKISDLDLIESSKLEYMKLYPLDAPGSAKSIRLHPEATLKYVSIKNFYLSTLDIPNKSALEYFYLSDRTSQYFNGFGNELDFSQAMPLKTVSILSSHLQFIDLSGLSNLEEVTVVAAGAELQQPNSTRIKKLILKGVSLPSLDLINEQPLQELSLINVNPASPLDYFETNSAKAVEVKSTPILNIDLAQAETLTELTLKSSDTEVVTLPKKSGLVKLSLDDLALDKVFLKDHVYLEEVSLNRGITAFSIDNSPQLLKLNLKRSGLIGIKLNNLSSLTSLNVSYSGLAALDLSALKKLETLDASNNSLKTVNLTNLPIKTLDLSNNELTEVNYPRIWSEDSMLTLRIDISNNYLTEIWSSHEKVSYGIVEANNNNLNAFPLFGKVSGKIDLQGNNITDISAFINEPVANWPQDLVLVENDNIPCTQIEALRSVYQKNVYPFGRLFNYSLPAACVN